MDFLEAQSRIADHMRRLREGAGLTLEQAAERATINKGTIYTLENKRRASVDVSTIFALCDAYGVTLGEFFQEVQRAPGEKPSLFEQRLEAIGAREFVMALDEEDLQDVLANGVLKLVRYRTKEKMNIRRLARAFLSDYLSLKITEHPSDEATPKTKNAK